DLQEEVHRLLDVGLRHRDDVVDQGVDDPGGQLARPGDGDALGDAGPADLVVGAVHVVGHGRVALGLDADQLDARPQVPGRHRHAGQQAAAAHRHDEGVEVGG